MKFDVIIGNPPYQLSDGGAQASASPIYHHFVNQAKKLRPRHVVMVIPSRWFSGGKGLDEFRATMLGDNKLKTIVDYFDSTDCFPGVDISGGICYFLWGRDETSKTCDVISYRNNVKNRLNRPLLEDGSDSFIRFNEAISIIRKVKAHDECSFSKMISPRKPFGLTTNVYGEKKSDAANILLYSNRNVTKTPNYISLKDVPLHKEWVHKWKVCTSYAYGERGDFPYLVIGKPFIAAPESCCTETYIVISTCENQKEAENICQYMCCKLVRFLVLLKKNTQHATAKVYELVPMQDFSKAWTDEELYKKYGLTEEEIAFIESMIRPMEVKGDA